MATLEKNIKAVKDVLKSEDVLVFEFASEEGKKFAAIYVDGIIDKELLGELVIKPLSTCKKDAEYEQIKKMIASPEFKDGEKIKDAIKEISAGNVAVFIDGEKSFMIAGLKSPPVRAVAELGYKARAGADGHSVIFEKDYI